MRTRIWIAGFVLFLSIVGAWAQTKAVGVKSCEELKTEIDAKLKAKGVIGYTLEIRAAGEVKDEKVVGSCERGTKKIVYSRK